MSTDPGVRVPTHLCKICGALWIWYPHYPPSNPGSWSLFSLTCGQCCDNAPMGEQIEPLYVALKRMSALYTTRGAVMNPPESAAEGSEARNRNSSNVMGLGEVHRAAEARPADVAPLPLLLWCPECGDRHIDVGEFATKVHHTHACQSCGMVWRPAIGPTVGVQWLPGFKNER